MGFVLAECHLSHGLSQRLKGRPQSYKAELLQQEVYIKGSKDKHSGCGGRLNMQHQLVVFSFPCITFLIISMSFQFERDYVKPHSSLLCMKFKMSTLMQK